MSTVPQLRDDDTIRKALLEWLAERMPEASNLAAAAMSRPQTAGGSNETLLVDLTWSERDCERSAELVLRIAPTSLQIFLDAQFENQYRVLETLAEYTDVPVPPVWGYQNDPALLGAPFWVMERVHGEAPADFPPYNQVGFLVDATPEHREELWRNSVETLAAIHRVPSQRFEFLHGSHTDDPLARLVSYWKSSLDWAAEGRPEVTLEALHDWLVSRTPADATPGLSWGDARMGNMLFRDWRCVTVLDWEMVSLAGPHTDLAWWLLLDEALGSDIGLARLPGLGGRADTIALWEEASGLEAGDLEWYEAFAGFRLGVILLRGANIRRLFGVPVPKPGEFGSLTGLTRKMAERFDLPWGV